jgi:hypothetical protein
MKFSFLPLLAAGVGLAVQQANASPIRVVVVSSHKDVTSNLRFGLAGANNGNINNDISMAMPAENRRPCPGQLMRDKAISISNTFRKALGLPLIETSHNLVHTDGDIHGGIVHITPSPFIGTPSNLDSPEMGEVHHIVPIHAHHAHHMKHHRHETSFLGRVHHALMALGPWEGRAVAFVLGCGIGVLLRMMWVMTIVAYRMIKGDSDESPEYTLVCEHYTEAANAVPPPSYILEKAEGAEDAECVDVKDPIVV